MTKIRVIEDGTLTVDGSDKGVEDLTQEFLERLVRDSLDGKVAYNIEGDMPIARFFKRLDEGTRKGSELYKLKQEVDDKDERQASD